MNRLKFALFLALSITLVASTHTSYAYYASTPTSNKFSATISTSKAGYGADEPITLSGMVKPYEEGRKLSIIVRDSADNVVSIKTASVNPDSTWSFSITDTAKWQKGSYKVAAQYGSSDVDIGTASFTFDPSIKSEATPAVPEVKSEVKTDVKSDAKSKSKDAKKEMKKEVKKKTSKDTKKATKAKSSK
jgi:hypothetical protein